MKGSERVPSPEEIEKRSPQAGEKIEMLIAKADIHKVEDGFAYFYYVGEPLIIAVDQLTLIEAEEEYWVVNDWKEIHAVDPNREEIWQRFAESRDDITDIFHAPANEHELQ